MDNYKNKTKPELIAEIEKLNKLNNSLKINDGGELLAKIAENYPNSYVSIIEKDLTVGFSSGKELKKLELDPNTFIGLSLDQVFAEQAPIVKKHYLKTFKGEEQSFELFINEQYQLHKTIPLTNDSGKIDKILSVVENITERKKAEEALKSSEFKFRTLADYTSDWEYWENENNKIIYMSPSCHKITGYTQDEFISNPARLVKIIHSDDVSLVTEHITRVHGHGHRDKIEDLEFRIIKKDSSIVNLSHVCRPIFNTEKKYLGRRVSNRDITESKRIADELRNSEERLKILFDYAPDAYYLNDIKGNFIDGNIAAEKLLGYNRNELIGKSFLKLNLLSPNQLLKAAKLLTKNIMGQGTGPDELVLKRKDKSKVTVEIITHPIKLKERTVILGIARDITLRKLAEKELQDTEARYSILFQASADGILIAEIQTKQFKYANPAICLLLGYSEEELKTMSVADIHPKDASKAGVANFEAQVHGNVSLSPDIPCLCKDGSIIYADINSANVIIENVACRVGFFRDITTRKKMEETIQNREKHLASIIQNPVGYMIYRLKAGPDPLSPIVTHVSPSIADLTGVSTEDSKNYMKWFQNVHPDDLPRLIEANQNGMKPPFLFEEEFRLNHPTKGLIWLQARTNGIPYSNDPDNIEWAHGILIDITERKLVEDELKIHQEHLEELVKERTKNLEDKNMELERFNQLFEGREYRIKELKDRLKEFENKTTNK